MYIAFILALSIVVCIAKESLKGLFNFHAYTGLTATGSTDHMLYGMYKYSMTYNTHVTLSVPKSN